MSRIAATGRWGTVEWALDARGLTPAAAYFQQLSEADRAKLLALFKLLAEMGKIENREKFRALGSNGGRKFAHLFEFKSFQQRFLGDFRPGRRFLIAHGVQKKRDKHDKADLERTVRILAENDAVEARKANGKADKT